MHIGHATPHATTAARSRRPAAQHTRPAESDPIARVDQLIEDIRSGSIKYAPEIAARIRPTELTLGNFPCQKYIIHPTNKRTDARKLPTEIVPRGEKSIYKHAVTVDSKLTTKENEKDLESRVESIRDQANELKRQKTESLNFLFEGDNADGKDGFVNHVFALSPLTNQGVASVKAASEEQKKHDSGWRLMPNFAGAGQVGFQNRTGYGDIVFGAKTQAERDVLTANLRELEFGLTMGLPMTPEGHIALPDAQGNVDPSAVQRPPMRIIKVVPSVSSPEQAARLADRLINEKKRDKESAADVAGHPKHNQVQSDFVTYMRRNSMPWSPTYLIPHDNKLTGWRKVAQIADETLADMDPQRPKGTRTEAEYAEIARPLLEEARKARRH